MRPWLPILLPVALLACEKDDTGVEYGIIEGDIAMDGGETVTVATHKAFGYDRNGTAALYFSSGPDATCADVGDFLGGDRDYDPTPLFSDAHCNVFAMISDYPGGEASYGAGDVTVTWALNCVLGDGDWNWELRGDDTGFYWSGRYWQGWPETWNLTLSGGAGSSFVAELEMNDYQGNFIYESMDDAPASGLVSGATEIEWCDAIGESSIFNG
jgi:hypothetical protein